MTKELNLPPEEKSIYSYVKKEWEEIFSNWEDGYNLEERLEDLSHFVEENREKYIKDEFDKDYDWGSDFERGSRLHNYYFDRVRNRKIYIEGITEYWRGHFSFLEAGAANISTEAFKAIILVNGAALISALAILSGQVENPKFHVTLSAKFALFGCFVSLIMASVGYAMLHSLMLSISGSFKYLTFKPFNHNKIFDLNKNIDKLIGFKGVMIDILIYGAVGVFSLSVGSALFILIYFV